LKSNSWSIIWSLSQCIHWTFSFTFDWWISLPPHCELWSWCLPRYQGFWVLGLLVSTYDVLIHMLLPTILTPTTSMKISSIVTMKRVWEVEHGNFNPIVFSTSDGMVPLPFTVAYKRLTFLLSHKWKTPYCKVMSWFRCCLDFSLLKSTICVLGVVIPPPVIPLRVILQLLLT